jgi:integrase
VMPDGDNPVARLKRRGKKTVVRERYQRPGIMDLGSKWKIAYWDYSSDRRRKRSRVWAKSIVPSRREAQRLADEFMGRVNARNNDPANFPGEGETLSALLARCRQMTWPFLKNSTTKQYGFFFETYIEPRWGRMKLRKLTTMAFQEWFNSFHPRLSQKTIKSMHGALRCTLNQAIVWGMLERNPAIGVKLPRRKSRKPPVVLTLPQIRAMLEELPEPTRSIVTLIVFGSMRVGEVLALRWKRTSADRVQIIERVYDGEFDDVKTEAGEREVPFDSFGAIAGALRRTWEGSKFHGAEDLVFANKAGNPLDTHNLLQRHIKPAAVKLGLSRTIDFRSFRTMHASLMRRTGARPEVTRDNMGHSDVDVTLNVYSHSWWDERVDAVSRAVAAVFAEPAAKPPARSSEGQKSEESAIEWVPFWEPQAIFDPQPIP